MQESPPENTLNDSNVRAPRPLLEASTVDTINGIIYVKTGESQFEESDPWINPPGTNLLANIFTNAYDSDGNEMVNTLPSTPTVPYNLHHGPPQVSAINMISPTDDLENIFNKLRDGLSGEKQASKYQLLESVQFGIDILEGRPINDSIGTNCYNIYGGPCRMYSGFPLLHYNGPEKIKKVTKLAKPDIQDGDTILYNVNVRQLWYDSHIESNTGMLDLTEVQDVPWTITYYLDVLNRGEDDFSPYTMFLDYNEKGEKIPHIGMDQSFFPMEDGTRTILKIKMPPGKYYNLVYTWGWRMHPPRIQVMEDRDKVFPDPANNNKMTRLDSLEINVFGPNPTLNQSTREAAIGKISDLSPAKRMWNAFRAAKQSILNNDYASAATQIAEGREAFRGWKDRTHLPDPALMDSTADLTLLYVNNTIYGGFTDGGTIDFPKWRLRGDSVRVTLKNGDYFWHAYQNVDFGGARGWENAFKSSVRVGGSGCWFTFGRNYWWKNLGTEFVRIPPAEQNSTEPHVQKVHITFNYEPSRRLRFYQFDPFHHDVAIFSVH
jgi:hypothetical protein